MVNGKSRSQFTCARYHTTSQGNVRNERFDNVNDVSRFAGNGHSYILCKSINLQIDKFQRKAVYILTSSFRKEVAPLTAGAIAPGMHVDRPTIFYQMRNLPNDCHLDLTNSISDVALR